MLSCAYNIHGPILLGSQATRTHVLAVQVSLECCRSCHVLAANGQRHSTCISSFQRLLEVLVNLGQGGESGERTGGGDHDSKGHIPT